MGPEIFRAARAVLATLGEQYDIGFEFVDAPAGDVELKRSGKALPKKSFEAIRNSDACLKAPVGETAKETILKIRQELDLYANLRPARNLPFVESKFPSVDLVIVRENTEDLYSGEERLYASGAKATALKIVTRRASEKIARFAFDLALSRNRSTTATEKSVVCVDKSNVLPKSDGLFFRSCRSVSKRYPSVQFSKMYVDSAAMNLIRNPEAFDVIVTMNMYGDILSDEASALVGGLGVAPSANIGDHFALFEPVHGAAPDIAGSGTANPTAMLLSVKMMLDWLGNRKTKKKGATRDYRRASEALQHAIFAVGESGVKTPDIGGSDGTDVVARAICVEIERSRKGGSSPRDALIVEKEGEADPRATEKSLMV